MADRDRARDDAQTSNDFGRAAAQACILINGGAATAVLAYFHPVGATPSVAHYVVPAALFIYAFGVFLGALSFPFGSKALAQWMMTHEGRNAERSGPKGDLYWQWASNLVFCGLIAFACASALLAVDMFLTS